MAEKVTKTTAKTGRSAASKKAAPAPVEVEFTPSNGEFSEEQPGQMRITSPLQGGNIIVTDEEALRQTVDGFKADVKNAIKQELASEEDGFKAEIKEEIKQELGSSSGSGVDSATIDSKLRTFGQKIFNGLGIDVFKYQEEVPGCTFTQKIQHTTYRIPGMEVDKRGNYMFVNDMRNTGEDYRVDGQGIPAQNEIVFGYSRDGLETIEKSVVIPRVLNSVDSDANDTNSRTMDPTILYDKDSDKVYILAGCWIKNATQWMSDSAFPNGGFKYARMAIGTYNSGRKAFDFTLHSVGGTGCDIVLSNFPSGCRGFIGGTSSGIKHSSGKLIFPMQWNNNRTVEAGLIVGTVQSNGNVDWEFKPGGTTLQGKSENSVFEDQDGNLIMVARVDGDGDSRLAKSYITTDFGTTWAEYAPYNGKVSTRTYGSQGSAISFTTRAGKYIVLQSRPQIANEVNVGVGSSSEQYYRDQITLYYMSKTQQAAYAIDVINYPGGMSNGVNPAFGGYSSICYNCGPDGEKLYIYYEYKLGTQVQDISYLIPLLNQYADTFDKVVTNSALSPEELEQIKTDVKSSVVPDIMDTVGTKLTAWPRDFVAFVNSSTIPADNAFSILGPDLGELGKMTISGSGFITGSAVNPDRVSVSDKGYNLLKVNYPNNNTDGSIRGPISGLSSLDVVTLAFNLFIPSGQGVNTQSIPVIRFFDDPTSVMSTNNKGGFEVGCDGVCYITKTNADPFYTLPTDKLLNIVIEYTSTGATLYVDGEEAATKANTSVLSNIKSATYVCMGGQGSGKQYTLHVGNFAIYGRSLTKEERLSVQYANGRDLLIDVMDLNKNIKPTVDSVEEMKPIVRSLSKFLPGIYYTFTDLPGKDKLILNIGSEVIKEGQAKSGNRNFENTTIETVRDLTIYRNNVSTTVTDFGTKDGGSGVNDISYNSKTGTWYIGQNKLINIIDLTSIGTLSSAEGFSVEVVIENVSKANTSWTDCFAISTVQSLVANGNGINLTNGGARTIKIERKEGTAMAIYADNSKPDGNHVLDVVADYENDLPNGGFIKVVFTVDSSNTIRVYKDYSSVEAGSATANGSFDNVKYISFNHGYASGGNVVFGNIRVHKLRVWKGKVLTGDEVAKLTEF